MTSIVERLQAHSIFGPLGEESLAAVADCGTDVTFNDNEILFRVDDEADEFFLIEAGRVAIELDDVARPGLMISTVGAGELLGVSWILPPYRWTFDARAMGAINALRFDATCLRAKCDADPALGYALYKSIAGVVRNRLVAARLQILDLYGDHAR